MNDKVVELQIEFAETLRDCERFCFAARARELQVEAIGKLQAIDARMEALKAEMVQLEDEDAANCLLSMGLAGRALCYELEMWVALKDDNAASAWDSLVDAQMSALSAMQAHSISSHLETYVKKLELLEELLFPPITFMSPGLTIYESKCSICGSEYGECEHVKGRAYMGQMCSRKITKCSIRENSLVSHPANKHARLVALSEDGVTRDLLTWRVLPQAESESQS